MCLPGHESVCACSQSGLVCCLEISFQWLWSVLYQVFEANCLRLVSMETDQQIATSDVNKDNG